MILDFIVGVLFTFVEGVLGLLPTYTPPDFASLGGSLGQALASANQLFPIATVGACIGLIVALQLFVFAWHAVVFVYELIPFKAT